MFKNYFLVAWRNLSRHKLNTVINILGLTLAITVCLVVFILARFELSYDTFHADKDRLYRFVMTRTDPTGVRHDGGFTVPPLPEAVRRELSGFETVSAFYNLNSDVIIPGKSGKTSEIFESQKEGEEASDIIIADDQYFDIFKYQWLAGNPATALKKPYQVVLSEKEAIRYFGKKDASDWIGRQIIYADSLRVTVSGIVKDWTQNSDFDFKDFISYATVENSFLKNSIGLNDWYLWNYRSQGIVKLSSRVSREQVEKQFPAFLKAHLPIRSADTYSVSLQPMSDIHFNDRYPDAFSRKANRTVIYSLIGIAIFILLIAGINFINLSTAQSVKRAREIGVRKVLGSSRSSLVIQFLTETFVVVLTSVLLAMLFANPVISVFHDMIPPGMHLSLTDWMTDTFLILTILICSLLAGLYPAKVLSSYQPALSLKGQGIRELNGKSYLRKSLIIFQFSISLIFIIGTLVINKQIRFILNEDPGFNKDAIVSVRTPRKGKDDKAVLNDKFRAIAGIKMTTTHLETPAARSHPGIDIEVKGTHPAKVDAFLEFSDENYVPLFELKIIAGRNVLHSDSSREFLINETAARALGFQNPSDALGSLLYVPLNMAGRPIVGIIKDFHSTSFHEKIEPFFLSTDKNWGNVVSVKLSSDNHTAGQINQVLKGMEKAWKSVYPDEKFEYSFFDETIARLYDREKRTSKLMNIAMAIAIFISCMGLLGLAAFTAEQRTREIGIRKVFGASVPDIISMLSLDFIKPILVSIVIASPVAYYFMHQWLQDFAYRVDISWWIYAIAGICAIMIALLTVSTQAIRAASANPVESLRAE